MSENTYQRPRFSSVREGDVRRLNELCRQLGMPLLTGNERDTVSATFNALTELKNDYTRRSAVASSYPETISASHVADQVAALLDTLGSLRDTTAWTDVLKAFKGFGNE